MPVLLLLISLLISRDFSREIFTKYDMQTNVGLPQKRKWGMKAKWGRPSNHAWEFSGFFLKSGILG